ncbi:SDR family oxidoreductase [Rhizobium sp. CSW-27]|uniref:SDR family NAD(P)-dependent oxidoreductase n=1 Tax=Rhizobium sp. CSW-27 TaxID=2839985 RepID=UPI001C039E8A|nr:SDR family oxidoreductase [Rhizobium sp. CSW-27]MBT9368900.1 SDR family oxidoreductase [Rhizobium sp. CSW-27]
MDTDAQLKPAFRFADLEDRAVLVTGGGSGIGAAFTEAFARQGARVAFVDIARDQSLALVAGLEGKTRHPVHYIEADLARVSQIRAAVAEAAERMGGIGVLVNNAALDDRHEFLEVTEDYWDRNQAINLKQMFFCAQAAAPHLMADGRGAIVNLSSISFLLNMGGLPSYTTAKAGILGLTKSLAGRLGPDGVRVNALLPGMIVTERQKALWLTDDSIAAMIDRQCLKRSLTAIDMVGPCLFLASSASAGMSAQWITVDGGTL